MTAAARAVGSSGGTSNPVSPSATISGIELTFVATTGFEASIASSSARPKPSQRAGWTSSVRPPQPRGDVGHAAEQVHRDVQLTCQPLELRSLRALAEHDELGLRMAGADVRQRPHRDVQALLRLEPADGEQHARIRPARHPRDSSPTPPAGRPARSG